jgi:hypothetical protein
VTRWSAPALAGAVLMSTALANVPRAGTSPVAPPFQATVEPIAGELAAEMTGVSWRPGCPVPISELRLISMPHRGFDDRVHHGELVVHEDVAADVVSVFAGMYADAFPIRQIQRIEAYGGDDDASMAADNTSAFNCREITGGGAVSNHALGLAIDINPVENPYVRDGTVLPPAGADYLDRQDVRPGMIVDGEVTAAFAEIGFDWGGSWRTLKDYQHFEAPDRVAPDESAGEAGELAAPNRAIGCSAATPGSEAWTGTVGDLVDPDTGQLDPTAFNAFLAGATPPVSVSPCDATRVLLHADRSPGEGETLVVVVDPSTAAGTTVKAAADHLLDDSTAAVRYELHFVAVDDGSIRLTAGAWSQRCQPGRGHEDFSIEPCV